MALVSGTTRWCGASLNEAYSRVRVCRHRRRGGDVDGEWMTQRSEMDHVMADIGAQGMLEECRRENGPRETLPAEGGWVASDHRPDVLSLRRSRTRQSGCALPLKAWP